MLKIRRRTAALATAIAVAVLPAIASHAATATFPGSITITSPATSDAVRGTISIDWRWRSGTYVKSSSRVDVIAFDGIAWTPVARGVPIRSGGIDWQTPEASTMRTLRATVSGTRIRSTVGPIRIDNMKPEVEIIRPTTTEVIVDDQTLESRRYVVGRATVEARATDDFTGIAHVEWTLDGNPIEGAHTTSFVHDFGTDPGNHQLTAIVTDAAGNSDSHTIEVLALPGPSSASHVEPPVDPSEPPSVPVDPDDPPTLPDELPVDPSNPPSVPVDPDDPPAVPVDPGQVPGLPEGVPPGGIPNPVPTT